MIRCLSLLFLMTGSAGAAIAAPISARDLMNFADQYEYKDNRKDIQKQGMYQASRDCCLTEKAYPGLEAYQGTDEFRQVALFCDHCGIKEISAEQIKLCQTEFGNLYRSLFQEDMEAAVAEKLIPPPVPSAANKFKSTPKVISKKNANPKIRVSSGGLKCDLKGGFRFRIDLFVK